MNRSVLFTTLRLATQYDDIPVEVSGHECPEPMLAFNPDILGESLIRNLALARYERPTPVQKYSIPIGTASRNSVNVWT